MPIPPLYDHQKKALDLLGQHSVFGLLMEMGTGKTRVCIEEWKQNPDHNLLVIAPKSVYRNWKSEIDRFLDKDSVQIAFWRSNANNDIKNSLCAILKDYGKPRCLLMNIEALSTVKDAVAICRSFMSSRPTILIVDESTRIRTHNSQRTKEVINLGDLAAKKRILSGLITPRSPMDLYSQFFFLSWKIIGARNFYTFRARYAIMKKMNFGGRNVDIIVGFKNIEELQKKILPFSFRVLKDDCLDLPPKIYTERSVELSPAQTKAYTELKKRAMTVLEGGQYVTSTMAVTLLDRLHQIVCGQVKDDLGNLYLLDAGPRETELFSILDETEGKAIIWAPYRNVLSRLTRLLKERYGDESTVDFWGDTSDDDREIAKTRFQEDSSCRYFVGNPSTGGLGLTLHAAHTVVYYSNSYDLEHRMQSEDRAHRAGLDHSVTYVDIVAKNTIDEKILDALKHKINLAASITGEQVREWIR